MKVVVFQPPITQFNTPYPSGAYLASFFRKEAAVFPQIEDVEWIDLNNDLFHSLFSKEGIERLFSLSSSKALKIAEKAEESGDEATAFNLRRYVSQAPLWIQSIDIIDAIACGNGYVRSNDVENGLKINARELCHQFVRSPYMPRGYRMEQYIQSLSRDVTADDAYILASLAFADLSDYIVTAFDKNFSLVRYAESLACSTSDFTDLTSVLDSPILKYFYNPIVCSKIEQFSKENSIKNQAITHLFCISVPFPGTFVAALSTGKIIKSFAENTKDGFKPFITIGGGYANTELRNVSEKRLFDYIDCLSYDRGFGSYHQMLQAGLGKAGVLIEDILKTDGDNNPCIGKIRFLKKREEIIIPQTEYNKEISKLEDDFTRIVTPDYEGINFTGYPRLADDANPMHRLWSDGSWLKAYLAHGCYWHRCTFCDNKLDYVCNYKMVDVPNLYQNLFEQSEKTGICGIHFVDEAAPPQALKIFGMENCRHSRRFTFWGNIRFEKVFTRDLTDFLSYAGLTGVSGGIECATSTGLLSVNKGTNLENIVASCAAFKESGILVHAYMIYGYWQETPQDLINSMETLRQMFDAGLLDSAFFHKFTLTRHSGVYSDWLKGKLPELVPLNSDGSSVLCVGRKSPFAENDLRFKGEEKSEIYADALNTAVESWMHGENLTKPVCKWFNFKMPKPTVSMDYVDSFVSLYEKKRDAFYKSKIFENAHMLWLGGKPVVSRNNVFWMYMGEMNNILLKTEKEAEKTAEILESLRPEKYFANKNILFEENTFKAEFLSEEVLCSLHGNGLIVL